MESEKIMSEVRFRTDELLEQKVSYLMKELNLSNKKEVFEYLVTKQFEKMKGVIEKNV